MKKERKRRLRLKKFQFLRMKRGVLWNQLRRKLTLPAVLLQVGLVRTKTSSGGNSGVTEEEIVLNIKYEV